VSIAAVLVVWRLVGQRSDIAEDARELLQAVLSSDSDAVFDRSVESVIDTGLTREGYRAIWAKRIGPFLSRCKRIGPPDHGSNRSRSQGTAHIAIELPESGQQTSIAALPFASERGGMVRAMDYLVLLYYYEARDRAGRGLAMQESQLARANGFAYDLDWLKSLGVRALVVGPVNDLMSIEDYIAQQRERASKPHPPPGS
jgi:hypothetical protein